MSFSRFAIIATAQWLRALVCCCCCCSWICFLVSYILLDIFWDDLCFIAIFVIVFFVVTTLQYHGHSLGKLSLKNRYSRVFVFFLSVIPLVNLTCYTKIGMFQLSRFKLTPGHSLKPKPNTSIFSLSIWALFLTFCNFSINLGLG